MLTNPADRRIVKSVIDLAHNFELFVVADGVDDREALDSLTLMGCKCAQGAWPHRPGDATLGATDLVGKFFVDVEIPTTASAAFSGGA